MIPKAPHEREQVAPPESAPEQVDEPTVGELPLVELQEAKEMREFLIAVGHFMDLPTKRPTRATLAIPAIVPKRVRLLRWAPIAAGALVASVLAFVFWNQRPPTLPDALIGEWVTKSPRYADRALAFTPTEVVLGVQQGQRAHYRITRLETQSRADSVILVLSYEQNGEPTELHATLINGSLPRLVFSRPQGLVWERRAVAASK